MKLKLNRNLALYEAGDIVEVEAVNGVPVNRYWRKRLKDSQFDNCVEIIEEKKVVRKKIAKDEKSEVLNDSQ
jgi:hypothetical protein